MVSMFERLFSLEWRRRRLLAKVGEGPLRDYLAVPFSDPARACREVEYVALDLETTGLDPRRDEILSIGFVAMRGTDVELASASHWLVRPTREINEASAVIHQITDDRAATGMPIRQAMVDLLRVLAGKVLIAHHAKVELGFIGVACERLFGGRFLIPVVDTQAIAVQWFERRNQSYRGGDLRLARLRERYNLPRYRAHDALSDALGAGELFAAQVAERESGHSMALRQFLLRV